MQKNTKKKIAPILAAAVIAAVTVPALALLLLSARGLSASEWPVLAFLGVYILAVVAILVGVLAAMRERLREIDRGEEDEAGKY